MSLNVLGGVLPAAAIGLGSIIIRPRRGFLIPVPEGQEGPPELFIAQAVVQEHHTDTLTITQHPVESGAAIADHAYKEPAEITIVCGWSNSPSGPGSLIGQAVGVGATLLGTAGSVLASIPSTIDAVLGVAQSVLGGESQDQTRAIYQKLLEIQASRVPFSIFTGKRDYASMLFSSITVETDETKENSLWVVARCKQVLIVTTQTISIPSDAAAMTEPEQTAPVEDQGSEELLSADTMMPNSDTFDGAMEQLSGDTFSVQSILDGIPDLQGPLSELSNSLSSLQENVLTALDNFPKPFELPFADGMAQSFGISLSDGILSGIQEQALDVLKSSIGVNTSLVNEALQQVNTITGLPDALAGHLQGLKDSMNNALDQVLRVSP